MGWFRRRVRMRGWRGNVDMMNETKQHKKSYNVLGLSFTSLGMSLLLFYELFEFNWVLSILPFIGLLLIKFCLFLGNDIGWIRRNKKYLILIAGLLIITPHIIVISKFKPIEFLSFGVLVLATFLIVWNFYNVDKKSNSASEIN